MASQLDKSKGDDVRGCKMDVTAAINMIAEEEACEDGGEHSKLYEGFEFYDDVSGKTLNGRRAIESRGVEMEFFKKMRVYEKVPRWYAQRDGCEVITTRWLDVDKGTK